MGKDLLRIPVFKETIDRCQTSLAKKGLDLIQIITSDDPSIFENVLNSFVGIGAVQLGMINVLREVGVEPDYFLGPSFGEVATGYADGCLTEEQAILSAYYRGLITLQGSTTVGRMAFVLLGWEKLKEVLPENIDIAAHMDENASVVSGPKSSVEAFVEKMGGEGILTMILQSSNVGFHSHCVTHLAPALLDQMKEIIPKPKTRSKKWVSASVPYDRWDEPGVQMCSAEYYTNNFVSCVILKETCELYPKNSIILEISPHFSLSHSIQNNFPEGVFIPIADKKKANQIDVFLQALQDLSKNGVHVDWERVAKVFDSNNNGMGL